MGIELVNFIDLTSDEKNMILKWRNNLEIRKYMYNQKEIGLDEHLAFIENLKNSKDKLYFLVKDNKTYIGVIDFTQIITNESLHMGVYANPDLKGNGKKLLKSVIGYSFNILNVKKIYSEVLKDNLRAFNLYVKFGFKVVSEKLVNNKKVICMQLGTYTLSKEKVTFFTNKIVSKD
ncbi:MAG: UDP-4-amino-4,6-dideoxy-N-acetyl-beta-L-altrosamine N-acetyltransferase [Arcobacter sp.]|nr:MAG: UDP-4-amino-4,6-dideoxy-N-acetyl-beta-L-altrosamine N-acetyltransferase [Arcobacter sp.]